MSQMKAYDLAYICYYAEKIELSAIALVLLLAYQQKHWNL